jgi:hypothetical protein
MTSQIVRLRSKVLLPLGLCFLVLFILGFSVTYLIQKRSLDANIEDRIANARVLFRELLKVEAEILWSLSSGYRSQENLQAAFLAGDRERLLAEAQPLYSEIERRHNITHFYFHRLDKTCFLRVHNPERHDDQIVRHTLNQAAQLETPAYGIELGPLGTMTLRLVQPWRVDGKLIGFLELGKEIDKITPVINHILDLQLVFTVEKKFLDRQLWEEGEKMLGKSGEWDAFPEFVVVSSSFRKLPSELGRRLSNHFSGHNNDLFDAAFESRTFRGGAIPLVDAAGQEVGDIFAFANYSTVTSSRNLFLIMILLSVLVAITFYALFTVYIGGIENNLQKSMDSLDEEINQHLETARELARHRDQLEELSREQSLELAETQAEVKILSGFLPICSCCKKIRNEGGAWEQLEMYIKEHSEAEFSHSYCPDCARKFYAEFRKNSGQ